MLCIFFLFLVFNVTTSNAMETEETKMSINNNGACPKPSFECGMCKEDFKAIYTVPVSAGINFLCTYLVLKKLFPTRYDTDGFVLATTIATLPLCIPTYYLYQSLADHYLMKLPWKEQCVLCEKNPTDKWQRGINALYWVGAITTSTVLAAKYLLKI